MLAGALLHSQGIVRLNCRMAAGRGVYMAIGWRIGLGLTDRCFYGAAAIAANLVSIFALMAICAAMAWGMATTCG